MSKIKEHEDKANLKREIVTAHAILSQLFKNQQLERWSLEELKSLTELLRPAVEYYNAHEKRTTGGKTPGMKPKDDPYTQF